jgi:chemotaxis family two-component system response regulator Rcp1
MLGLNENAAYILIAEDNPADVELVREALEDRQVLYRLHIVSDGEQAVTFIQSIDGDSTLTCPKLFLMDLHLPKRDGEEILRCLRSSERCFHTPVIVMTSLVSPRDIERTAHHKNVYYFQKPNTLAEFMKLGDVVKILVSHSEPSGFDD